MRFIDHMDENGKKCFNKTCCLEALGMLSVLLLAPDLLQGSTVVHVMDNIATCLAWDRGRSSLDAWTTTVVRACAHVCAALNINLHTEWRRRRSDRNTKVVDNLSHDRCEDMMSEELQAYLSETQDGFPEPLLVIF